MYVPDNLLFRDRRRKQQPTTRMLRASIVIPATAVITTIFIDISFSPREPRGGEWSEGGGVPKQQKPNPSPFTCLLIIIIIIILSHAILLLKN